MVLLINTELAEKEIMTGPETDHWIIKINMKLKQASKDAAGSWDNLCIYRIPQHQMDRGNRMDYIPQLVSFGPYHYGKKRLRNMDRHKWRTLNRILERNNQSIELYLHAVKELETQARSCYEGTICLSSNEFVEMMVLDSCFMLEVFQGAIEGFPKLGYSSNDPTFGIRTTKFRIHDDMLILENQIPLFILDRLLCLHTCNPHQTEDVAKLALRFFQPLTPTEEPPSDLQTGGPGLANRFLSCMPVLPREKDNLDSQAEYSNADGSGQHCLDVFRRNLLSDQSEPESCRVRLDRRQFQLIHCATELKEAGVKFKRRTAGRFWDIKFNKTNGVLEIPCLMIQDTTKSRLLNLIAYEQSHLSYTGEITSYALFLDSLINTAADVNCLCNTRIIENWLGNDDYVAELFNTIGQGVHFDQNDSYLCNLTVDVNEYCAHKRNAWKASLRHKYFNSPWTIISLFAAVMLLALTSLQTFFTVFPYYVPRRS